MKDKKYQWLERDASAAIKAIMCQIEEAAGQAPEVGAHPYQLEKRRKVLIRTIWTLMRNCMSKMEKMERSNGYSGRF